MDLSTEVATMQKVLILASRGQTLDAMYIYHSNILISTYRPVGTDIH